MDSKTLAAVACGATLGAAGYALFAASRSGARISNIDAPSSSLNNDSCSQHATSAGAAPQASAVTAAQPPSQPGPTASVSNFEKDEILAEQFTRNVQFFGQAGQSAVAQSFVVVIGLGGVGSHAAHLLLRSGVGRLRLVDFDQAGTEATYLRVGGPVTLLYSLLFGWRYLGRNLKRGCARQSSYARRLGFKPSNHTAFNHSQVTLSSLNRHAVATRADVGLPKATCLQRHFKVSLFGSFSDKIDFLDALPQSWIYRG